MSQLYADFLASAWKNTHVDKIVFCLPYWNIGSEMIFMPQIHELNQHWKIDPLCVSGKRFLRHSRPGQSVGREVVSIVRS